MSFDLTRRHLAWPLHALAVVALASVFQSLSMQSVAAVWSLRDRLLLALIWLALAATLHGLAQLGWRQSPLVGGLASLPLAATLTWHLREQTGVPHSLILLVVVFAIVSLPVALLERVLWQRAPRPLALPTAVAAALLVVLPLVGWYGAPTFRWHLLRHTTLLGTPLWYLLGADVAELRDELEREGRELGPPPPPEELPTTAEASRPDIVFFLIDTLRADALSPWDGGGQMPGLDAWAEDSWRFVDVVANSSWTRPSVASMLSGLLPEEHGARDVLDPLPEEVVTLAEALSDLGYRTVAFQTNVGAAGREAGFAQGFDVFRELEVTPYARAEELNREVRRWLEARDPENDKPVFLYLHYLDPHEPYLSGDFESEPVTADDYLTRYDAELAYVDGELATIRSELRAALGEDTVMLLTSDHGEEFFEHELFGHGHSLYDEVVKVPLVLEVPATGDSGTIDARLEGRDLFELVVRLAGDPEFAPDLWAASRDRDLRSLSLDYTGSGRLLLRPYRRHNLMRAVDTREHRFIWSGYGPTRELYATRQDPGMLFNRIELEPDLAAALEGRLGEAVRGWRFPEPIEPDERTLDQLRALGYVE